MLFIKWIKVSPKFDLFKVCDTQPLADSSDRLIFDVLKLLRVYKKPRFRHLEFAFFLSGAFT